MGGCTCIDSLLLPPTLGKIIGKCHEYFLFFPPKTFFPQKMPIFLSKWAIWEKKCSRNFPMIFPGVQVEFIFWVRAVNRGKFYIYFGNDRSVIIVTIST